MKIRWNRQSKFPLLLLLVFYAAGAVELTDSYRRGDCSLPAELAAGAERVAEGLNRISNSLSRLRIGSWLGNSWAPGSIGWMTASASSLEDSSAPPPTDPIRIETTIAPVDFEVLEVMLPTNASSVQELSQGVRLVGCGTRPLIVLTRPEVVVVTAEFPRVETPQGSLITPAALAPTPTSGGCRPLPAKSST